MLCFSQILQLSVSRTPDTTISILINPAVDTARVMAHVLFTGKHILLVFSSKYCWA